MFYQSHFPHFDHPTNDLKILFVHEEITLHANKYKLRTTGHSNQPISELFHQSNDVRRLQRIWPEDLAR
jgi:hypothetical protein